MSTEKDREVAIAIAAKERGTDEWTIKHILYNDPRHPWFTRIEDIVGFVDQGIQHARQGERERMNRFANKLVTEIYEAVNQHRKANDVEIIGVCVEIIIDEFLEQEKSK